MRVMGFDVSSSTIGWGLFNIDKKNNIKLLTSGFFKPAKNGNLFENLRALQEEINQLLKQHSPDQVSIEDIVQFLPRQSSANTIIKLAIYNRIVGLTVFNYLGKPPELCSVLAIRHGLKQTKDLPTKDQIPALVESLLKIKIPKQLKKTGSLKEEFYDQADGIACGLFYCYKLTNKLKNKSSNGH